MTPTNDSISKPPLKRLSSATDDDESPRKRPKLEDAVADELHQIEVAHAGSASTHSDSDDGYFPSNMTTPRTIQNSIKRALDTADTDTDQSPRKRLKQTVSDAKPPITDATGWTGISSSHKSKEGTEEDAFAPAQPMPRSMKTEDSDEAIVLNSHPLITSDSPPVSQYVATVHPSSIPSINLLPPEILANIFSFHAFNAPLGYDPDEYDEDIDEITDPDYLANETESDSYFPDKLGWARVTHVCQKWRYVALDDARLWSTVVVDLPGEFLEEILQRSKGALLDLTIPLASQFRVIEPILKENMHRVRSLTLDNLSNEVASLLALPAPQLEELELPFGLEGRYMIPTPFLVNNAPCLKRLTVAESIDFPWDSPVLDHLVELTIDRSTSQMRACAFPAPNAFFNLIGRLDRIQVLRLRNCLPIMPHVTLDPRIALPTLKHFELEGTSEQCSNVLERIEFDLQARFFLTCREHHFGHERMFNELYRHFRGDSRMLPVRTLAVSYSSEQVHHLDDRAVLAFRAWNTSCVDKEEEEKEKEKDLENAAEPDFYQDLEGAETKLPDVRMTFAMKTWFVEQESYRLCALVPYDALRVLSMDVRGTRLNPESIRRVSWPLEHVLDMFWSVPKLAHLRLGGNGDVDSRQAAQFFRGMRERGTDEPARLEMFPDLKTLTLVDVSTCFSCHGEALFDILQHMLRLRKLDDMPIGTVYVKERRYEDKEWAKWKELEDTKVVFRREVKFVEEGCKWVQF